MYAHNTTANISLLGVRTLLRPTTHYHHHLSGSLKASFTSLPALMGWREGEGGGHSGHWCGLSKKKIKKKESKQKTITVRIGHFFSLRVQMHTYPPAVALCLVSLVPSFPPSECRTAPCFLLGFFFSFEVFCFLDAALLSFPFVHRSELFFSPVLLSFGTDI